jgi:hypothetical protein
MKDRPRATGGGATLNVTVKVPLLALKRLRQNFAYPARGKRGNDLVRPEFETRG